MLIFTVFHIPYHNVAPVDLSGLKCVVVGTKSSCKANLSKIRIRNIWKTVNLGINYFWSVLKKNGGILYSYPVPKLLDTGLDKKSAQ